MRKIAVTRYVTPLREGGSLPAIVEDTGRCGDPPALMEHLLETMVRSGT